MKPTGYDSILDISDCKAFCAANGDAMIRKPSERLRSFVRRHPLLYDLLQRRIHREWRPSEPEWYLDRLQTRLGRAPRFIQIGANDGLRNDPVRFFIVWRKWNGILVEPLPAAFELLARNYSMVPKRRIELVQAAIGATDSNLTFWTFDKAKIAALPLESRLSLLRRSSFDRRLVETAAAAAGLPDTALTGRLVRTVSVADLVRRRWNVPSVNVVAIDAEGLDGEIIRGLELETLSPHLILFETHQMAAAERVAVTHLLEDRGYRLHHLAGDCVAENVGIKDP